MTARRVAAIVALVVGPVTLALAVWLAIARFPRGLVVLGCVALAIVTGWYGLLRRGVARIVGLGLAAVATVGAALLLLNDLVPLILIVAGVLISVAAVDAAFRVHVSLPPAKPPARPALFINPRSGGGKAEKYALAQEAQSRGYETTELEPGDDLGTLVRQAVDDGADGLAMAGGDGSQAIVASIAAEFDLPYACIPSGTRNHFALDLGVDRDDVVGALDAFVDGGEHRVDLGEVNDRVFVNNVSLGLYAEAVERPGYREAKLRTLLDTVPDTLGPGAKGLGMRWKGPGGHEHEAGAAILVSNNRYRLGGGVGPGTRPSIDDGLLAVMVVGSPTSGPASKRAQRPVREWSTPEFEIDADNAVAAGIDGETVRLEPPVRFRIRPGVLRAHISRKHPGASPSAVAPEHFGEVLRALVRTALGRN